MTDIIFFVQMLGLLVIFPIFVLNAHAYIRIRPLGYFPPAAAMLVLGVDAVAFLAAIGLTVLLLPRIKVWWEGFIIFIGIWMFVVMFVAFGCVVLVRKLPKIRDSTRVFGPRRARFSVRRTVISLGYLIIAGGIMATPMISYPVIAEDGLGKFFIVLALLLFAFGLFGGLLIWAGKSLHQETIEDAIKSDPRLPVVYLRAFAAEHRTVFARRDEYAYTFEAYLGHAFRERIGPFVALGSPEDHLPPWGGAAVRTYADDEGWYEYFERLASRAGCIVMLVSDSDNLQQELTFIRREGLQRRLFIFTAKDPKDPSRGALAWIMSRLYGPPPAGPHRDGLASWEHFAETLGKLGFELGDDPGRGGVVTFDSEGKAIVLVRGADTQSTFVEPVREYLVRTVGLDREGAVEAESHQRAALASENVVPTPG